MVPIDVLGGRSHGVRLEENAPTSLMLGVRDALDESVLPTNLYEAQLRHPLRGGH